MKLLKRLLTMGGVIPLIGMTSVSGHVHAFFAMSESTPTALLRELLRSDKVHLFDSAQFEADTWRFSYLNELTLPRGTINLGEDISAAEVRLVSPTVQLAARQGLHPVLSDLLSETARARTSWLYAEPMPCAGASPKCARSCGSTS